ncbi:MAG: PLP-dependent aminotransferase family protein [Caulobacterales bacterium]|nr:PLP-dependent aminotransferase family protein [Caulobacterales bacterium]
MTARALESELRRLITEGALAAGDRLPTVREAAYELGCAPGTVSRAYAALQAQGLTHAQVGRGTFVGEGAPLDVFVAAGPTAEDEADLSRNLFLIESPAPILERALSAMASRLGSGACPIALVGGMGWTPDREAALPFLARWRDGLTPGEVALTNGGQAAVTAAVTGLTPPGGVVACDALTYPGLITAAQATGRKVVAVEGDAEGMSPDALAAVCARHGPACVFLMPTAHNPTGLYMPAARREAIAEIAEAHELTVLEDEVYGFLDAGDAPSFSRLIPARAVLLTGLSKCVAAVLRVGFVAGPGPLIRRVAAAHNAMNIMVSPILSGAAALIMREGELDRRIAAIAAGLERRAAALAALAPDIDPATAKRGMAWLVLPDGWDPDNYTSEARALGVRVATGREFAVERRAAPNAVRVSLAAVESDERFRAAIGTLIGLRDRPYACELRAT